MYVTLYKAVSPFVVAAILEEFEGNGKDLLSFDF
jgi:hypothetical protein